MVLRGVFGTLLRRQDQKFRLLLLHRVGSRLCVGHPARFFCRESILLSLNCGCLQRGLLGLLPRVCFPPCPDCVRLTYACLLAIVFVLPRCGVRAGLRHLRFTRGLHLLILVGPCCTFLFPGSLLLLRGDPSEDVAQRCAHSSPVG